MITISPAGMYGLGCQGCKLPYQYAVVAIDDDDWPPFSDRQLRFVCDACVRRLFPSFPGRPSGHTWHWWYRAPVHLSTIQAREIFLTFLESPPCHQPEAYLSSGEAIMRGLEL